MVYAALPEFDRGDGVCMYLKDNKCVIYNTRPAICRSENLSFKASDAMMAKACDKIRNLLGDKNAV